MSSRLEQPLVAALLAALDDDALDALAERMAPRLEARLGRQRDDEWFDAKGAAGYLGMSLHALHRLSKDRENTGLPAHQDGPNAKLWFLRSELDEWRRGGAQ